jgi:hypothetical protein
VIALEVKLTELAAVIRSKNSGPYELTLDIIFKDPAVFEEICQSQVFTKELLADLYGVPLADVLAIIEFQPVQAIKINLRRPLASGALGDTDVYGAQQHAPLVNLRLQLENGRYAI